MVFITAIAPGLDTSDLSADLVLKSTDEYVAGYSRIVDAVHTGVDLKVVITDPTLARWFRVMALHYGPTWINFKEMTIASILEERIGLKIPPEISQQEIQGSGLMDLFIPASGQASFQEYLLENFFGSFLTKKAVVYRVNEILAAYIPEQWQESLKRPLIKKIFQARFRELHSELRGPNKKAEGELLNWLEVSPEIYFKNLSALKLLESYPSALGEQVFGNIYGELLRLNLDLRRIPLVIQGNEKTIDEIRLYLNGLVSAAENSIFQTLLEQVSGLLEIELDSLINLMKSGKVEITKPLIHRVQRKFTELQDQPHITQTLADLALLVAVSVPSNPNPEWEVDEWLKWAVDEYLPYRFWLENTNQVTDEIGDLAGEYSDWLYKNYGNLLYNSGRMAWKAVLTLKDKMKAHPGPVLIVMIDNFNAKFYPVLQRQLHQQGFFEQDSTYCISMLPSFTEVGKKCVITGHFEPFESLSYGSVVEETWKKRLGKKVCYLSNILELRAVNERQSDVYVLNYLPIDIILHQHDSHLGVSHTQTVQVYLAALATDIRSFARRLGAERDLMVILLSDHGSTRIPRGIVNVIQDKLYKQHAIDEHTRFISLDDKAADHLSDNVKYQCYLLRGKEYHLPDNYLIARRLYRFLPTDDSVYIHGGLTPEETIIPVAVYLPVAVTPKPLAIRLVEPKKILAGTRPDLVFEITNHNNYSAEQVVIEIPDSNIDSEPIQIDSLHKLQRGTVKLKVRCPSNADLSANAIKVRLTYQFIGQEHEQTTMVPAVFDSIYKTKFNLDNF